MKLQMWIMVQPELIAWSSALTGSPQIVYQQSTGGMGEAEEAVSEASPEDVSGPTTVTGKLMGGRMRSWEMSS